MAHTVLPNAVHVLAVDGVRSSHDVETVPLTKRRELAYDSPHKRTISPLFNRSRLLIGRCGAQAGDDPASHVDRRFHLPVDKDPGGPRMIFAYGKSDEPRDDLDTVLTTSPLTASCWQPLR